MRVDRTVRGRNVLELEEDPIQKDNIEFQSMSVNWLLEGVDGPRPLPPDSLMTVAHAERLGAFLDEIAKDTITFEEQVVSARGSELGSQPSTKSSKSVDACVDALPQSKPVVWAGTAGSKPSEM